MSNEEQINASALKWTKQKKNSLGKDEQITGSIRYLLNFFSKWFNTVPPSKLCGSEVFTDITQIINCHFCNCIELL